MLREGEYFNYEVCKMLAAQPLILLHEVEVLPSTYVQRGLSSPHKSWQVNTGKATFSHGDGGHNWKFGLPLNPFVAENPSKVKRVSDDQVKISRAQVKHEDEDEDDFEEQEEDHGETLCGACGESYAGDEFWICCDMCEKWFHGKCVNITPARAEHIKHYKCPSCTNKRARP